MLVSIDCRYIRERPSGIGAYVRALLDRLPARALDLRLRLWVDPRAPRPLCSDRRAEELVVSAPANGLRTLAVPSWLAPLDDVDVLHAPFNILGRGVPCPSVVTMHDLMWLEHPAWAEGVSVLTPFKTAFYRDGILRALQHATRIIAISRATAEGIRRIDPRAARRVRVVHHGVEARFTPPADREVVQRRIAKRFGITRPYFLVVGQNTPSKNHMAVLRAFARAELRGEVELVMLQRLYASRLLGLRGSLRDHARALGVAEHVRFLSGASPEEVVELIQAAHALVQFSRYEGFGMPALEAMACGTPVIASEIPALSEVVGDAGLLVALDPAALAGALRRVASDAPLRIELGPRGLERSRSFSWDRSAGQHLEIYREAADFGPIRLHGAA